MLYGGVAWSELPFSTSKEQEQNGECFEYNFLLDEALQLNLEVQAVKSLTLSICKIPSFAVGITEVLDKGLSIDEQNTWNLS
jgi:hypothetical protein